MSVSGNQHRRMVDVLLGYFDRTEVPDQDTMLSEMAAIAPQGTMEDLARAQADAEGIIRELHEEWDFRIAAWQKFMPLFEGAPEDANCVEWARQKAADGNPLAEEFLRHYGDDE